MWKKLKVAEVKSVDDSDGTRGVRIGCGEQGSSDITLIFDKVIAHKQTDHLADVLRKMRLTGIIVDTP